MHLTRGRIGEILSIDPSDEELEEEVSRRPERLKSFLILGLASTLCVLGVTYTALLLLNGDKKFEYGQAVTQQVLCDASVDLTPSSGFVNTESGGKFTLDSIYLENISQSCIGFDFILRVYNENLGTPLVLTDAGGSTSYDGARIWFKDAQTFQVMGAGYIDALTVNEALQSGEEQSVQVVFDADSVAKFADSGEIRKITLEAINHNGNSV
jgi:hypothetical protein